jgi:hypothetical protein
MVAERIAAASAALVLAVFATTVVAAADRSAPATSGLAALRALDGSRRARPAPQPALTAGDVPPGAADAVATVAATGERPQRPWLAEAPHEVILYSNGCDTWLATEPWEQGREFGIHGVGRSCSVGWTEDGDLVAVAATDGGDTVAVIDRAGAVRRLVLPGLRVRGQVAVGQNVLVFCAARGRDDPGRLFRWEGGTDAASRWGDGCLPAVARDGQVAWVVPTRLRRRAGAAIRVGAPSGGSHTTIAALNDTTVDSLSWTGDGRRLVVVTRDAARTRVLAIDLAGEMTNLLSIPRGDVTVHPSPAGERVIVAEQDAAAASVQSVDASTGRQEWSAPVDGGADVTWSPSGSRLLVSDRRTWSFVEPATGIVRLKLGRVGDAPAWCCPTPAPAPPAANG